MGDNMKRQLDSKCLEIVVQKLLHSNNILENVVPVGNRLLGYLGSYFYLHCKKVNPENPEKHHKVTYFLKIVPEGKKQKNFVEESGVFNTEIALYTLIFPEMLSADNFTPKCIEGNLKDSYIVLNDMNSEGYEMLDKFKPLHFRQCKIVLETMGKFHGKSIIFENSKNQKNIYQFLKEKGVDLHYPDKLMQGAITTNIEGLSTIIDLIKEDGNDKVKEGWEKVKKKLKEEAAIYYSKIKCEERKKVLCHSDLWGNNILWKFDKSRKPIQCCLVDFQLARYAPPALDILIFLHFTTSRELRKEKFQDFLKVYYSSLKETLGDEELDINMILPWNDFLNSIEFFKFPCMTASLSYISIDLLESDLRKKGAVNPEQIWEHLSVNTGDLVLKQYREIPHYQKRIQDSLLEFYELLAD